MFETDWSGQFVDVNVNIRTTLAAAAAALILATAAAPALADDRHDWEAQVGAQEFQKLQQQGVIVQNSPDYAILNPIAARISATADRKYDFPFHFILVRDKSPNAFAVPGGNVYVTTAMMQFAQNKEELAGVLCHETSHDIHHDVWNMAHKEQTVGILATLLAVATRNNQLAQNAIGLAYNLQSASFSRPVESAADHEGAYTCAQSGYNPWGMVWLFQRFEQRPSGVPLEMLSDHPRDDHRVTDLENEMHSDPRTFGRYSDNQATATRLR